QPNSNHFRGRELVFNQWDNDDEKVGDAVIDNTVAVPRRNSPPASESSQSSRDDFAEGVDQTLRLLSDDDQP
ncbi:MAG: hypothetical protein MI861_21515, partial [Pirellulales bacterium]|nr:hypothetical protein [Pirellulales bacterium]